jgi:hypothetical protein
MTSLSYNLARLRFVHQELCPQIDHVSGIQKTILLKLSVQLGLFFFGQLGQVILIQNLLQGLQR